MSMPSVCVRMLAVQAGSHRRPRQPRFLARCHSFSFFSSHMSACQTRPLMTAFHTRGCTAAVGAEKDLGTRRRAASRIPVDVPGGRRHVYYVSINQQASRRRGLVCYGSHRSFCWEISLPSPPTFSLYYLYVWYSSLCRRRVQTERVVVLAVLASCVPCRRCSACLAASGTRFVVEPGTEEA